MSCRIFFVRLNPRRIKYGRAQNQGLHKRNRVRLLDDVKLHGFKNPVSVRHETDGALVCTWGHTRCWVAEELGVTVPAIVFDFKGDWGAFMEEGGVMITEDEIPEYFDTPHVKVKKHKGQVRVNDGFFKGRR